MTRVRYRSQIAFVFSSLLLICAQCNSIAIVRAQSVELSSSEIAQLAWQVAELYSQGKFAEAEQSSKELVAARQSTLGGTHPDTLLAKVNLCECHREMGNYREAELVYDDILASRMSNGEETNDEEKVDTAMILCNLGLLYCDQGKYGQADKTLERASSILARTRGTFPESYAHSLNCCGLARRLQGDTAAAMSFFQRAEEIVIELPGKSLLPAAILNNLADLYQADSRYDDAKYCYTKSCEMLRRKLGSRHPQVALALHNLADLHREFRQLEQAKSLDNLACDILKSSVGESHPHYALCLGSLAETHFCLSNHIEAKSCNDTAAEILKRTVGESHPWLAANLRVRAAIEASELRFEDAEGSLRKAVSILEQIAPHSEGMKRVLRSLQTLYESQARTDDAKRIQSQLEATAPN